jgi:N-carbamoylputrescine amidase
LPIRENHKIASIQIDPQVGQKAKNMEKVGRYLRMAKGMGAGLIVFPELCNSGYKFESRSEAFALSEPVPGGPTTKQIVNFCKKENVYVIMGVDERDGHHLYNSAILAGPEGFIDVYRKKHLFFEENLWFEPGDRRLLIYDAPIGKIGVQICYEIAFPEMARIYMLKGVDILVNPAAFVRPINSVIIQARAAENRIFVVSSGRTGEERGLHYAGLTMIVAPNGEILTKAADDKEEIRMAEANRVDAIKAKRINDYNYLLADRRTDIYDEYLGCKI